jgi:hypothetical protein
MAEATQATAKREGWSTTAKLMAVLVVVFTVVLVVHAFQQQQAEMAAATFPVQSVSTPVQSVSTPVQSVSTPVQSVSFGDVYRSIDTAADHYAPNLWKDTEVRNMFQFIRSETALMKRLRHDLARQSQAPEATTVQAQFQGQAVDIQAQFQGQAIAQEQMGDLVARALLDPKIQALLEASLSNT